MARLRWDYGELPEVRRHSWFYCPAEPYRYAGFLAGGRGLRARDLSGYGSDLYRCKRHDQRRKHRRIGRVGHGDDCSEIVSLYPYGYSDWVTVSVSSGPPVAHYTVVRYYRQ